MSILACESEEEVTDIEQAENWFSLTSAQRICGGCLEFLHLKFILRYFVQTQKCPSPVHQLWFNLEPFDEHVRHGKTGGGNAREMDFESFLDFVLALENKDTPEGLTYLFQCLDLRGRGYLTTADIHTLFRDVHQKWIGGNYELCIEDMCAVSGPMTIERIFSKKRENRKKNDRRTEFTVRHVFAVSREFAVSYRYMEGRAKVVMLWVRFQLFNILMFMVNLVHLCLAVGVDNPLWCKPIAVIRTTQLPCLYSLVFFNSIVLPLDNMMQLYPLWLILLGLCKLRGLFSSQADMRWIKTIKTIDYLSEQADEDTIPMTACTILWSHRSF
ncbi:hypothetical protein TEA_022048 [Camellia sinensis var. sinensis]|uniref:EF-hand domain-containing protein n=1 Tax=Camellia sinensis var. sinensis TaxID=542762 RepID=A0A4S4DNM9_CAMSN|nr:hypothetical protein TEA_022048 [Camellia sinensis var. sinensis]